MNTDYKIALVNARKMLYDGFYDTDYIINWMDGVLAGKQNPKSRMTEEAKANVNMMISNDQ